MLSPNEIAEKKFDKVVLGGYDMGAVDDFLDVVEQDYIALVQENTLLKNKMKVLVKKIEEYRAMDESMRKALNSAQSMAAQIIDKAKAEAKTIREDAQKNSDDIISGYEDRIAVEERRLAEAKSSVEEFVTRMTTMYSQGAEMLRTVVDKYVTDEDISIPASKPAPAVKETVPQHFEPSVKPAAKPVEKAPASVPAPAPAVKPAPAVEDEIDTDEFIRELTEDIERATAAAKSGPEIEIPEPAPAVPSKPALADTAKLPNLPPVGGSAKPQQGNYASGTVYPNSVVRHNSSKDPYDEGETILLTPKPKFEFNNLQFGDNYDSVVKNKK